MSERTQQEMVDDYTLFLKQAPTVDSLMDSWRRDIDLLRAKSAEKDTTILTLESKLAKARKALEMMDKDSNHLTYACMNGEFNHKCSKCLAATTLEETK